MIEVQKRTRFQPTPFTLDKLEQVVANSSSLQSIGAGGSFHSNDLMILVEPLVGSNEIAIQGKTVVLPAGLLVGRMDFTPNGADYYRDGTRSAVLNMGLTGFSDFFKELDEHSRKAPAILRGTTNKRMAMITKRLGFNVEKQDLDGHYSVIGITEVVRQNLEALNGYMSNGLPLSERLAQRAKREATNVPPASSDRLDIPLPTDFPQWRAALERIRPYEQREYRSEFPLRRERLYDTIDIHEQVQTLPREQLREIQDIYFTRHTERNQISPIIPREVLTNEERLPRIQQHDIELISNRRLPRNQEITIFERR